MKKISKNVSYVAVGALVLISFLFDYLLNKDKICAGFYLLSTLLIMPVIIYIMYLFVDIEKKYAYLHAVISCIIVNIASFSSALPQIYYELRFSTEASSEEFATIGGIIIINFFMQLVFWGFVYLMINYISKRKFRVKNI